MTGIALVTGPLFGRYFHKFVPSLPILHLLVWSLGGGFLWYVNGAVLNGSRRQHIQTFCIASAFVTSVLINIYAVPRFGARGAAVAAVVSNTLLWVLSYCWITKFLTLPHTMLARRCARIVGATLGMVLCVSGARLAGFHPLALVASGVLAYGVGIWLFGAFSSEVRNMLCDKTSKLLVLCRITQRL